MNEIKAARIRHQQELHDKEYQAREAELVQEAAPYWATIIADSDDEDLEWAELHLDSDTPPIPLLIRKAPDSLTSDDRLDFAKTEYLKQALQHTLQLPSTKTGPVSRIQRVFQTVAMERIDAHNKNESLPLVPVTKFVQPPDEIQHRPELGSDFPCEAHEIVQLAIPILPPPDCDDLMYKTPPLQQIEIPEHPPRIGRYDSNNYAYHYAATICDNVGNQLAQYPMNKEVSTDLSMMLLQSLRDFDNNTIDPGLLLNSSLAADIRESESRTETSTSGLAHHDITAVTEDSSAHKRNFHRTHLLQDINDQARSLHMNRRGRERTAAIAAGHCGHEARWRDRSRGRFVPGNGNFLLHELRSATNSPLDILAEAAVQSRGGLGYQRNGMPDETDKDEKKEVVEKIYEVEKWRSAEEWQEVVRTGGANLKEEERVRLGFQPNQHAHPQLSEDDVHAAMALNDNWHYDLHKDKMVVDRTIDDHVWEGVEGYVLQPSRWDG